MVPFWAVQVTALLKAPEPETVAANWAVAPRLTERTEGLTATEETLTGTVTVTLAVAVSAGFCTLVAVTTSAPPEAGAVYSPALVMAPRWADQVTAALKLPVPLTVALNVCWAPVSRVRARGLTETELTVAGTVTTTSAVPIWAGVSTLVAVTRSVPPLAGAVYRPALVMVPFLAVQVTPEE